MRALSDLVTDHPDEFDVMVVRDGTWICAETLESLSEALFAAKRLLGRDGYERVAVQPQIGYMRPFQTHEMVEVIRCQSSE